MAYTPEQANVRNEDEFADWVMDEVSSILSEAGLKYEIFKNFGLDLAVFIFRDQGVTSKFLEMKVFRGHRPSGIGIGNDFGYGTQIDLLLKSDESLRRLSYSMRWVLGDYTRDPEEKRYVIFDNLKAKNAVMSELARGKQNNLNVNKLIGMAVDWDGLSESLADFLLD